MNRSETGALIPTKRVSGYRSATAVFVIPLDPLRGGQRFAAVKALLHFVISATVAYLALMRAVIAGNREFL
ncbi:MAG: hypothetical protein IH812_04045 [Proteobacteria bacterium]|nr:hypothetical protein [Pseudomonadota bacterium]